MVKITATPEVAKARIQARQEKEQFFTPLSYVDERLIMIDELTGQYQSVADIYIEITNGPMDQATRHLFFKNEADGIRNRIRMRL